MKSKMYLYVNFQSVYCSFTDRVNANLKSHKESYIDMGPKDLRATEIRFLTSNRTHG